MHSGLQLSCLATCTCSAVYSCVLDSMYDHTDACRAPRSGTGCASVPAGCCAVRSWRRRSCRLTWQRQACYAQCCLPVLLPRTAVLWQCQPGCAGCPVWLHSHQKCAATAHPACLMHDRLPVCTASHCLTPHTALWDMAVPSGCMSHCVPACCFPAKYVDLQARRTGSRLDLMLCSSGSWPSTCACAGEQTQVCLLPAA